MAIDPLRTEQILAGLLRASGDRTPAKKTIAIRLEQHDGRRDDLGRGPRALVRRLDEPRGAAVRRSAGRLGQGREPGRGRLLVQGVSCRTAQGSASLPAPRRATSRSWWTTPRTTGSHSDENADAGAGAAPAVDRRGELSGPAVRDVAGSARRPARRPRRSRRRRASTPRRRISSASVSTIRAPLAPIGMTEGDRSTVHVDEVLVDAEHARGVHRHRRERLVDLDQAEVVRRRGPPASAPSAAPAPAPCAATGTGRPTCRRRRSRRAAPGSCARPPPRSSRRRRRPRRRSARRCPAVTVPVGRERRSQAARAVSTVVSGRIPSSRSNDRRARPCAAAPRPGTTSLGEPPRVPRVVGALRANGPPTRPGPHG